MKEQYYRSCSNNLTYPFNSAICKSIFILSQFKLSVWFIKRLNLEQFHIFWFFFFTIQTKIYWFLWIDWSIANVDHWSVLLAYSVYLFFYSTLKFFFSLSASFFIFYHVVSKKEKFILLISRFCFSPTEMKYKLKDVHQHRFHRLKTFFLRILTGNQTMYTCDTQWPCRS